MLSEKSYNKVGKATVLALMLYAGLRLSEPLIAQWLQFSVPLLERLLS